MAVFESLCLSFEEEVHVRCRIDEEGVSKRDTMDYFLKHCGSQSHIFDKTFVRDLSIPRGGSITLLVPCSFPCAMSL